MKLLLIILSCLLAFSATAEQRVVWTDPVFLRATTEGPIHIYFNANAPGVPVALRSLTGQGAPANFIYVHTGVSTNLGGWRHTFPPGTWGSTAPELRMERMPQDHPAGTHIWRWTIPSDIRTAYRVPAAERIYGLVFVFRGSGTGALPEFPQGYGNNFFIGMHTGEFGMRITQPEANAFFDADEDVTFNVEVEDYSTITFLLNDTEIHSATDVRELTHTHTDNFTDERYRFLVRAENATGTFYDSLFFNIRTPRNYKPVPTKARDGINLNFPNTGDVTFVLRVPRRTNPQPTHLTPLDQIQGVYELGRERVHIIGDFNNWQPSSEYQMFADSTRFAYWITLTGLNPERLYRFQYLVDESLRITDPFTELILDPWNDRWINYHSMRDIQYEIFPNLPDFPENIPLGLVATFQINRPEFQWSPEALAFERPAQQDLIIYEMLIRDFMMFPSYDRIIEYKFQHLIDLGINAIKIMPNTEFDGNNSWGYNPNHMFAVDKAYGTAESFKRFIDKAHSHGIAIIMDIVLNHQTGSSPLTRLFWNSQSNVPADDNPWFHPRATHPWNVFYQMNHRSEHTLYFTHRVLEFWMKEFRVDGFRFDLSKAFTFLGPNTPEDMDRVNPTRIQYWQDLADFMWDIDPTFYVILEHFANNNEERQLANHGLSVGRPGMMLWGNMNWAFSQLAQGWSSGSSLDGAFAKGGRRNAQGNFVGNRGWDAHNLIVYAESHDEERVSTRVGGFTNVGGQFVHAGHGRYTEDYNTRHRQAERKALVASFLIPLPGPTMIWQFGEFAFDGPLNICYNPTHLDGNGIGTLPGGELGGGAAQCRTGRSPLLWHYLEREGNRFTFQIFSGLIDMRLNHPAFTKQRNFIYQTAGANTNLQRWIIAEAYNPSESVVIVGNFDVVEREFTIPNIPANGTWYGYFSTDTFFVENSTLNITLRPGQFRVLTKVWRDNTGVRSGFDRAEIPMIIHPNPAQNEIFVDFETEGQREIQIYNLSGQLVQSLSTRAKQTRIDVSNLRQGSYIIIVSDGANISSQQIIIQ